MATVVGLIGALVGIGLFLFGFWFGKEMNKPKKVDPTEPTEEEMKQIREERERLIEDQKAFRELMNYNADMAYGITGNPLKDLQDKK